VTDPANRRQQIIRLTRAGGDKARTINTACDASYARLFGSIPEGKWKIVVESVELLAGAMRELRRDAGCERAKGKG
jgi:DNA-binding MarR family transcriptional regulator